MNFRNFFNRSVPSVFISGALLALAACDSAPEGQVVSVVNGDEITAQELNGELSGVDSVEEEDQAIRNAALDKVVERRLLASIARDEGIASSPDFILRAKKLEDNLLVQMLNEKLVREAGEPTQADIDQTMADNPQAFASRTLFAVDQVVFRSPQQAEIVKALADTTTMDEVVTILNRMGVEFGRNNVTVDSGSLPRPVFERFREIGTSEPIIIPAPQAVTVAKILGVREQALTGDQARPIAANAFVQQRARKALQERLEQAREAATIEYQDGYARPTDGEGGADGPDAAVTEESALNDATSDN